MIIHMTTVHPRDDSRIRFKEIVSLVQATDEDVRLFVQDGLGDEVDPVHGYRIVDTGPRKRRLSRMFEGGWRMISAVRRARPSIVFFHDPELLPWAFLLRLSGIKVVYDAHEDVPRQILRNPSLPAPVKPILSPIVSVFEWVAGHLLSAVVGATTEITDRFPARKSFLLRNFPVVHELHTPGAMPMAERPPQFAYIGMITEDRNIYRMIDAVGLLKDPKARLRLAGDFTVAAVRDRAERMPNWNRVIFDGWVSRDGVAAILSDARAGLVLLKPIKHEMVTLPIKMFEYMAAGLPIISSDFPLWREIIDGVGCGLLVDPEDESAIAGAMQWILDNPEEAAAMGARGRQAVLDTYNWESEAETLLDLYRFLGGDKLKAR